MVDLWQAKQARDLRDMWQGRLLAQARGKQGAVLLSVLAHSYPIEAMKVLLGVVFPGFESISAPFYCSAARIARNGKVCAHMIGKRGEFMRNTVVADSVEELQGDFRRLADRARLSDSERVELFKVLQKWLVADFRVKPEAPPEQRSLADAQVAGHA